MPLPMLRRVLRVSVSSNGMLARVSSADTHMAAALAAALTEPRPLPLAIDLAGNAQGERLRSASASLLRGVPAQASAMSLAPFVRAGYVTNQRILDPAHAIRSPRIVSEIALVVVGPDQREGSEPLEMLQELAAGREKLSIRVGPHPVLGGLGDLGDWGHLRQAHLY
eukprot:3196881-Rhodomonas_salina.2